MATYTWVGTDPNDPNDWNDPANWQVGGAPASAPPGPNDDVIIGPGSEVTGSGDLQSASMTVSGSTDLGTTSQPATFDTGALSVSGGLTLQGSGTSITDTGSASFANGTTLDGGVTSVQGTATFGSTFTLENAELDLSTTSTATLSTLTIIGATTLSGDLTTTALSDSGAASLTLGTGTLDVAGSSPSSPVELPPLTIEGNVTLEGTFGASSLTVLGGATLNLNAGDSLTAATAAFDPSGDMVLTDGTLLVTGNATLGSVLTVTGAGALTIDGTVDTDGGSIYASNNSRAEVGTLDGASGGITLSADSTSSIEIGTAGTASTATITIDSGVTVTESGSFTAPGIVVDGTLAVEPDQTLTLDGTDRGLSGSGSVQIGQGSSLVVDGVRSRRVRQGRGRLRRNGRIALAGAQRLQRSGTIGSEDQRTQFDRRDRVPGSGDQRAICGRHLEPV